MCLACALAVRELVLWLSLRGLVQVDPAAGQPASQPANLAVLMAPDGRLPHPSATFRTRRGGSNSFFFGLTIHSPLFQREVNSVVKVCPVTHRLV
uniref:Putative secreted protein n=1 Tax=Anopheles darlingi TaxID=43151 RepID=A0A2M4DKF3_ANODA